MGIELEIDMQNLGSLPLYPPRRRLLDLLPTFIMSWIRRKFNGPKATPREVWAVSGLMLRVSYNSMKVESLIEEMPQPSFLKHEAAAPQDSTPDDPFRFN